MKGKYHSARRPREQTVGNKHAPWILLLILLVLLAVGVAMLFLGTGSNDAKSGASTTGTGQRPAESYTLIDTAYGQLRLSEDCAGSIRHEEIFDGGVTMEVFYMRMQDSEQELFRICYGDTQMGEFYGKILSEGREIPVRVAVYAHDGERFPSDEMRNLYYSLMDQLDVVLESIRSDDSFVEKGAQTETENRMVKLTYWTLELPKDITWQESTSDQLYRVDFFGNIDGKTVRLYMVCLGDIQEGNVIGEYTLDGKKLPVKVNTYSLESQANWLEDEHISQYAALMDTIDLVLRAVTTDTRFSP